MGGKNRKALTKKKEKQASPFYSTSQNSHFLFIHGYVCLRVCVFACVCVGFLKINFLLVPSPSGSQVCNHIPSSRMALCCLCLHQEVNSRCCCEQEAFPPAHPPAASVSLRALSSFLLPLLPQPLPSPHFCPRRQTQCLKSSETRCWKPGFIISPLHPRPHDPGFLPLVTPARKSGQGSPTLFLASVYMHQTVPEFIPVFIHALPRLDSAPHSAAGLSTAVCHTVF